MATHRGPATIIMDDGTEVDVDVALTVTTRRALTEWRGRVTSHLDAGSPIRPADAALRMNGRDASIILTRVNVTSAGVEVEFQGSGDPPVGR